MYTIFHRRSRFGLVALVVLTVHVALMAGLSIRPACAADTRIGYIDSARIFQEYEAAKEAQSRFDRQVTGWRDEAAEKQKAVELLRAEVRDQSPILSSLKRHEVEESLQRAISEYERFIQDVWGPQGRAVQENERATGEVVTQIRSAVEKIASDRNLDLVLDAASGYLIYANKSLDLTATVIEELKSRSPATTQTPR
jgi:outer membrane protein